MNLQNLVGDLISQVEGGQQPGGLSAVLSTLSTSQVSDTVSNLTSELSADQRGNLVGTLLSGLSSSGVDVQSLLGQLGVNPAVADNPDQATPEEAAALAAHAHENYPGILHRAMSFYEEHPTLVKTLGLIAAVAVARHMSNNSQG